MPSTQQMDVEMKHRLPRARAHVQDGAVSVLDFALARNLGRSQVTAANHFGVFRLGLFQTRKMFSRDDQHMRGRFGTDVFKSEDVLVLIDFLRRNLAAQNAAENAVANRVSHRLVTIFSHQCENDNIRIHHGDTEERSRNGDPSDWVSPCRRVSVVKSANPAAQETPRPREFRFRRPRPGRAGGRHRGRARAPTNRPLGC